MSKTIQTIVGIDTVRLADALADDLTYDDLFAFVKYLDQVVCDWDFTGMLCKYFDEERAKYGHELDDAAAPTEGGE